MHQSQSLDEKLPKRRPILAEVFDPHRSVGQDHLALAVSDRRRGIDCKSGIEPPIAANRVAASRAINASNPACTKAVFSSIPVNSRACSINLSLMIKVVLICISMHHL